MRELCNCVVNVLQELEHGTIERCRGFAEHLSMEVIKQRKHLATYTDNFVVFRSDYVSLVVFFIIANSAAV